MQLQNSEHCEGIVVLTIYESRIDSSNTDELREAVRELVSKGCKCLVADVRYVHFIDSTGLGGIVYCLKVLGREGRLVLSGATENVMFLLKLTQMDRVFQTFDSVDGAVAALARLNQPSN